MNLPPDHIRIRAQQVSEPRPMCVCCGEKLAIDQFDRDRHSSVARRFCDRCNHDRYEAGIKYRDLKFEMLQLNQHFKAIHKFLGKYSTYNRTRTNKATPFEVHWLDNDEYTREAFKQIAIDLDNMHSLIGNIFPHIQNPSHIRRNLIAFPVSPKPE